MSVVDQLKNLFAKKSAESSHASSELSLAMADGSLDPMATGAMDALPSASPMSITNPDPDSVDADSVAPADAAAQAELISVPLLGRRTVVTHQRILFTSLALALVVLGGVAIFAVKQADKVAQQVAGTGQSLMQSQRLAKSVSQAQHHQREGQ
jgi:twitching motility protein PilJ